MAKTPIRIFVVAPEPAALESVLQNLRATGRVEAGGSTDPRAIKGFAAEGHVHAVLVSDALTRPTPEQLAAALGPALGGKTAFVLLTHDLGTLEASSSLHGAVRFPVAPGVLLGKIRRSIRNVWRSESDTRALQAEVELRFVRAAGQNYYELLGVSQDAATDEITAAYDRLSLSFHPDRLRQISDSETRDMALTIYMRAGDAYRTLRLPNERMRYDQALRTGRPIEGPSKRTTGDVRTFADYSDAPSAKKYLALAQKALIAGDQKMALAHLRFALTQDEDNTLIARKLKQLEDSG